MVSFRDLRDALGGLGLPVLGREAEIAVYMVHNTDDAEDYFFLFDFEEFADRSKAGIFVRPVLRVHAGRDDFSRTRFSREFRAVFAREFDRMRADLARGKGRMGWLTWGSNSVVDMIGGLVANLVLAVALSLGRQVLSLVGLGDIVKGRSAEAKLADEIDRTKGKVETALSRIEVTIHPELYEHAYRHGLKGPVSRMDRAAWPLPDFVRTHLSDGKSGSWWG